MARPLRIEFPGAIYHVVTRGVAKSATFLEDADYWLFLRLLKAEVGLGRLIIHALALMPNHPHMLCETPTGGLGRSMKQVLGSYAQQFNLKYVRFGHVFQARYRAILVEDGDYFLKCSRYIHRNPSKGHLVPSPDLYPWSSYRNYLGAPAVVDWVDTARTLSCFAGPEQYRVFVETGSDEDLEDPFEQARAGLVFGSEEFLHRIRNLVSNRKDEPEIPDLKALARTTDPPSVQEVAANVQRMFQDVALFERRWILIYALHTFARLSGRAIANLVGLTPSMVSRALHQVREALLADSTLRNRVEALAYSLKAPGGVRS